MTFGKLPTNSKGEIGIGVSAILYSNLMICAVMIPTYFCTFPRSMLFYSTLSVDQVFKFTKIKTNRTKFRIRNIQIHNVHIIGLLPSNYLNISQSESCCEAISQTMLTRYVSDSPRVHPKVSKTRFRCQCGVVTRHSLRRRSS